jgi:arylesterase/paraoxonase
VRGAVLAFAIDDFLDASSWRDRTEGAPAAFQPRGLHLYRNGETARLFVVNAAGRTVELYDVSPEGDLSHVETLTERRLTSPNDLVAVGPRAFYVSNDLEPGRDSPLGKLQFLLRAGSGRVLYFDGTSWGIAADGLRFANGVAVSADGSRFYAAETAAGALRIYERNAESGVLKEKRIVRIGAGLDNINVGEDGTLWIGAHSTTLREGGDATKPSLVIRYDEASGRTERIYANEGAEFSASTAAALHESTLLVGALDEEKFLVCRLPS